MLHRCWSRIFCLGLLLYPPLFHTLPSLSHCEAALYCQQKGESLPYASRAKFPKGPYWLGLANMGHGWAWIDGSIMDTKEKRLLFGNDTSGIGSCALMSKENMIQPTKCTESFPVTCFDAPKFTVVNLFRVRQSMKDDGALAGRLHPCKQSMKCATVFDCLTECAAEGLTLCRGFVFQKVGGGTKFSFYDSIMSLEAATEYVAENV